MQFLRHGVLWGILSGGMLSGGGVLCLGAYTAALEILSPPAILSHKCKTQVNK